MGRDREIEATRRALGDHRLVTLTGPAGVGKTRLAIEVVRPTGAWLVRLESAGDEAGAWRAIGAVLGLGESTPVTVLDRLSDAEELLLLDNCEHLIDVVPDLVDAALTAAPGLKVFATSQVPLGLAGERVLSVEPLSPTHAVTLFGERARRPLDDDASSVVAAVCEALDGLPLAIELAAARTKVLSVQEIARRLDDRFTLLRDVGGHRPSRQRTLAAAIAWSYDLLFPDDQRGLWALSCFSSGSPLPALEVVLGALGVPAGAAVDVIDRLAERSLVSVEPGQSTRYRLLDSVREFSATKLRESGEAEIARQAHAQWFAEAADRARVGTRGPAQAGHLALARAERANIDAALEWAQVRDPALAVRIVDGFGWAWAMLGAGPDGARRIRAALTAASGTASGADGIHGFDGTHGIEARFVASWLEAAGGDLTLAAHDLESAMASAPDNLRAVGQVHLAFVHTQQGRPVDVLAALAEGRPELVSSGRIWEEATSWLLSAWAFTALGQVVEARAACDEALRRLTPLGDDWALIHASALLGGLALAEGRFAEAIDHQRQAAESAGRLGFDAARALHLANLGLAQHRSGDPVAACVTLREAVDAAVATGDLRAAAMARVHLAGALGDLGETSAALAVVEQAHRWYSSAGGGEGAAQAETLLAELRRAP